MKKFTINDFHSMPVRVGDERKLRLENAARALTYQVAFLDDIVRAILPHDLILIGAPTGAGKTDMATSIALANAQSERKVAYFALEAEPLEIEQRVKYAWLSREAYRRNIEGHNEISFVEWLLGNCEHVLGGALDAEANQWMLNHLGSLRTFYRGEHFDVADLRNAIEVVHRDAELIVVDHLHYVDAEDDRDEYRAQGELVKAIRDMSIQFGRPFIVVAHLRKRDQRQRSIIPTIDDFHGSSNITKVATQVITIERAFSIEAPKWYLAPTYMAVVKDRRAGTTGLVALTYFDRRTRCYSDEYTLGRLTKGGTAWEQLKPGDRPGWARGHRQLEMEGV